MTGKELLVELSKLRDEDLKKEVVIQITEYASSDDSMGYEVEHDVDCVRLSDKIILW